MGCSEDGKEIKSEKSSPSASATEQTNVHTYPEWAAMQAYYGPGVAMPPYYNPAIISGQPPPAYVWGPQPMMSPYGIPYAAIYAPGGVYAHPAVLVGTPGQGLSSPALSEPPVAIGLSIDSPIKSPGNPTEGLLKKLKGFDGLAMSIGNGNVNAKIEASAENMSQRAETESSSSGIDENTEEAEQNKRKRSCERIVSDGEEEQVESKAPLLTTGSVFGIPITPANAAIGHVMVTVSPPTVPTALELLNAGIDVKGNSTTVSSSKTAMSSEVWIQNERELKREKRKQSNRDSAKRSRLRRQAVAEELGRKVDSLSADNFALKSEINLLVETSNKLRLENAALKDKFKSFPSEEDNRNAVDRTANLLSMVNNADPVSKSSEEVTDTYERRSKSKGSKFHQLLSAGPRADAVAAS